MKNFFAPRLQMNSGIGNIQYGRPNTSTAAGTGTVTGANDGVSSDGVTVKFGQAVAQAGDPAALTENREVPFAGNQWTLRAGRVSFNGGNALNRSYIEFEPVSVNGAMSMLRAPYTGINPAVPWEMIAAQTINGAGPTYDLTVFQGFNIDSSFNNSYPSWTVRMEYGYTGSPSGLYEYHLQFQRNSAASPSRLMSFTYQNVGAPTTDTNDVFFTATSLGFRWLGSNNATWFTEAHQVDRSTMNLATSDGAINVLHVVATTGVKYQIGVSGSGANPLGGFDTSWASVNIRDVVFSGTGQATALQTIVPNGGILSVGDNVSAYSAVQVFHGAGVSDILHNPGFAFQMRSSTGKIQFEPTTGTPGLVLQSATALFSGTVQTVQSSANGSGVWALGKKIVGAITTNLAAYVEVLIDGVVVKLVTAN